MVSWHEKGWEEFKVQNLANPMRSHQVLALYASSPLHSQEPLARPSKTETAILTVIVGFTSSFFAIAQLRPGAVDTERGDGEGEPGEVPDSQSLWFSHQLRWAAGPSPSPSQEPATCLQGACLDYSRRRRAISGGTYQVFYVNGSMGNPLYVSLAYKDAIVLPSTYIFFMLEMGEPLEGFLKVSSEYSSSRDSAKGNPYREQNALEHLERWVYLLYL